MGRDCSSLDWNFGGSIKGLSLLSGGVDELVKGTVVADAGIFFSMEVKDVSREHSVLRCDS